MSIEQTASKDSDPQTPTASEPQQERIFTSSNARSLAFLLLIILAFRSSIMSPYHVPTPSMEPTIKVGDRLLAYKMAYAIRFPFTDWTLWRVRIPERGDIIVFEYPRDPTFNYVKRVVGLPGDHIRIIKNTVFINGQPQPREEIKTNESMMYDLQNYQDKILFREMLGVHPHMMMIDERTAENEQYSDFPVANAEFVVPPETVFVLGDNRHDSVDSRVWGPVPLDLIKGKALFVIWSVFDPGEDKFLQLRLERMGRWLL